MAGRRTLRARWTAVLLGLLWALSLAGCGDDRDTKVAMSGQEQSPGAGRFVTLDDGIIQDARTGLEWTGRDSARDVSWPQADQYCRQLALGGRTDWRLPEIDELGGLYDQRLAQPCEDRSCHLDPVLELTGPYIWSATQSGTSRRFYFDFRFGTRLAPRLRNTLVRRALCVRRSTP